MRFDTTGPEVLLSDVDLVDASSPGNALRLAGTSIGPNDTAIAGHAIAAAVLVTNNVREFERVSGLALEDWAK
jgi:tRNA(fMet)-specific endonuclease VapC